MKTLTRAYDRNREGFLRAMRWAEHQALMVAHNDMTCPCAFDVNVVHPETATAQRRFERRRARLGLEYERENGAFIASSV